MSKVVIIGAGAMGLAAGWHAAKVGHDVTVLEADKIPGGMAAHFDFGGLSIERFYHFICKTDQATFDLMAELGIADRLRWRHTSMGYFIDGSLYKWGDPLALLTFPLLSPIVKFRYGWHVFRASKRTDWSSLHHTNVRDWVISEAGETVWNRLWARSFQLKFYELTDQVAAPWLGVRIKRLAASRKSMFQEELGYIDGGSETLIRALVAGIQSRGGRVLCGQAVQRVEIADGAIVGVTTATHTFPADHVISTVPTPFVSQMIPDLPEALKARYDAIKNIGAVCVILKLKRSVTPHFWVKEALNKCVISVASRSRPRFPAEKGRFFAEYSPPAGLFRPFLPVSGGMDGVIPRSPSTPFVRGRDWPRRTAGKVAARS